MKAAEAKSVATPAKSDAPFFNKGTDTALLNDSSRETSFFHKQNNDPFFVQTKLTVGQPNDKYEQEADVTADKVVQRLGNAEKSPSASVESAGVNFLQTKTLAPVASSISPFVQTKCAACEEEEKKEEKDKGELKGGKIRRKPIFESNADPEDADGNPVQRKCSACEEEEKHIHKKDDTSGSDNDTSAIENRLSESKGSGRPMSENTRAEMESSFGVDFSDVRIHDNSNAVEMNKGLNAQAFAHGSDIYFNSGKYDPESTSGKHLLAHELTHTVQQGSSNLKKKPQQGGAGAGIKSDAATPNIQASWYNFNIPFTDYQFDPSINGLKNAGNMAVDAAKWTGGKVRDGAVWVKDKAVEGFEWVFDQIKGLVNSGIEWLSNKFDEIKKFATSAFDSIKATLGAAVNLVTAPLNMITAAFTNMNADTLLAAWNMLTAGANAMMNMVTSVVTGILKIGEGIWGTVAGFISSIFSRINGVINSTVFGYLPDFLQKAARALFDTLKGLWDAVRNFWTNFWQKITAQIKQILTAIKNFVNKVLSFAIHGVIKLVRMLKTAWDLVTQVAKDPEAFIKPILEKLAAKLNTEAPPKAKEEARKKLKENVPNKGNDPSAGGVVQREPEKGAEAKTSRSTASYTEIDRGIDQAISKQWDDIKIVPMLWQTVKNMFWPPATIKAIGHEFYELWTVDWANAVDSLFMPRNILDDPLGFFHDIWSNFLFLLDFPLALWRRLNSILMLLMGYVTIVLVIIGLVGGAAVGGGVGGLPGAAAGLALAGTLGEGLMISFLLAEGITIVKALLDLFTARQTAKEKDGDYKQIAGSAIGIGIAIALEMLFAFLSSLVSEIVARIKAKPGAAVPEPNVKGEAPKPGEPVEPKPGEKVEPKSGEGEGAKAGETKVGEGEVSPSKDGNRDIRMNEKGKCEVCASPCADIRAKYKEEITPEIRGKIEAIENNPKLSEAAQKEALKPIEQELADLKVANETKGGAEIAKQLGLPDPPPGHHWVKKPSGGVRLQRNPEFKGQLLEYDPAAPKTEGIPEGFKKAEGSYMSERELNLPKPLQRRVELSLKTREAILRNAETRLDAKGERRWVDGKTDKLIPGEKQTLDPKTGEMTKGDFAFGHKEGDIAWKKFQDAHANDVPPITREDVIKYQDDPKIYQVEEGRNNSVSGAKGNAADK